MALRNLVSETLQNQGDWLLNDGMCQKVSVTIAATEFPPDETSGIIAAGTPVSLETSTGCWTTYDDNGTDSDGSGTGRQTMKGFLYESVNATTYAQPATVVVGAALINKAQLPVAADWDANGITDMAARALSTNIYWVP